MMKKNVFVLLFVITIIIGIATPAFAERLKYTGLARSEGGAVLASATVAVYLAGTTTPADVYEASSGGTSVNEVTTDSNGRWTFYADTTDYAFTQEYKVVVTKDGYSSITLDNIFILRLPTNAVGVLYNDGSGNYSWGSSLSSGGITLADASTLTLPAAAPTAEGLPITCNNSDSTCSFATGFSSISIGGFTASRNVEADGSGNLTSADTATTGTGAPVKATGPTITLGENSTINNGAAPTVNAAGEVAIDTTTDQFKYYGGAARVLPYIQYLSFVIPAPAEADDINIMKAPYGMTIIGIDCIVQGTTSATGQIQECDSAGANCADLDSDIVCDADGAADDGTLTDSAIASGAWLRWKTTSLSGTPTFLTVTVRYSVVAD